MYAKAVLLFCHAWSFPARRGESFKAIENHASNSFCEKTMDFSMSDGLKAGNVYVIEFDVSLSPQSEATSKDWAVDMNIIDSNGYQIHLVSQSGKATSTRQGVSVSYTATESSPHGQELSICWKSTDLQQTDPLVYGSQFKMFVQDSSVQTQRICQGSGMQTQRIMMGMSSERVIYETSFEKDQLGGIKSCNNDRNGLLGCLPSDSAFVNPSHPSYVKIQEFETPFGQQAMTVFGFQRGHRLGLNREITTNNGAVLYTHELIEADKMYVVEVNVAKESKSWYADYQVELQYLQEDNNRQRLAMSAGLATHEDFSDVATVSVVVPPGSQAVGRMLVVGLYDGDVGDWRFIPAFDNVKVSVFDA